MQDKDDLAEVAAAIVAAYQALRRPPEPDPKATEWRASGQVAPAWGSAGRRRGWKDVDRERG
ncbi:MAG TPA: hypothetical protein VMM78_07410 [Thermomicrobiales bacterium]|nr:hypothetical protein [Thermomicrobiales bacterium]